MSKRVCYNCDTKIPPETEHYILADEVYCVDCVDAKPYTAYTYYVDGEYVGCTDDEYESRHVELWDDEHEEDEAV